MYKIQPKTRVHVLDLLLNKVEIDYRYNCVYF